MILLRLFWEFFKVGLFSVGGGLATIPFLQNIGMETGWFSQADLANMIAISESTPGPIGINMASYVGFETAGILGGIVATCGLICPCVIVILVIAGVLQKFRQSKVVDSIFSGLRPASVALISSAGITVAVSTFTRETSIHLPSIILAVVIFILLTKTKLKKLHPICFIAASALIGIVFKF